MKTIEELGISQEPWRREIGECGTIFNSTFQIVATTDGDSKKEKESNTNLIAAAPEMYEALRMFVELCESYGCDKKCEDCLCAEQPCIMKARAVLAKASGEEMVKEEC